MESTIPEIGEMDSQKRFIAGKIKAKALVLYDFDKQRNPHPTFQREVSP